MPRWDSLRCLLGAAAPALELRPDGLPNEGGETGAKGGLERVVFVGHNLGHSGS